jgi:hypothetical protein
LFELHAGGVVVSKSRLALGVICLVLPVTSSCGSKAGLTSATGVVTVDGQPVESGTIQFQSADGAVARSAGGAIEAGKFELSAKTKLAPGKYNVSMQAFKKTNRVFNDPQKGQVAETIGLRLIDSPQEIELTSANYRDLAIGFSTATK